MPRLPEFHGRFVRAGTLTALLLWGGLSGLPVQAAADPVVDAAAAPRHALWELHGRHNTVYLLGSIHVLRPQDYPLAPALLHAYGAARALVMELDLDALDVAQVQGEMLASALLPPGRSLPDVLGTQRYERARKAAHDIGVELSNFDRYAPWFAAEAISQLQLTKLGFESSSGVEMYFLGLSRHDGKPVSGLETVHDQIALFDGLSLDEQADYLVSSLDETQALPQEVGEMVQAWQRGDTGWFERELQDEFGHDSALYASFLTARNRRWVPKIEALLRQHENYLVIVGTGHLVGPDSVVELLRKDGVAAAQE